MLDIKMFDSKNVRSRRVSRADLLRCIESLGVDGLEYFAEQAGYSYTEESARNKQAPMPLVNNVIPDGSITTHQSERDVNESTHQNKTELTLYRVTGRLQLSADIRDANTQLPDWFSDDVTPPIDLDAVISENIVAKEKQPLVLWPKLWPILRKILSVENVTDKTDIPKLIEQIARVKLSHKVPRIRKTRWVSELSVILDFDERTLPFHSDYIDIEKNLEKIRGDVGYQVFNIEGDVTCLYPWEAETTQTGLSKPAIPQYQSNTLVLIFSDLGLYRQDNKLTRQWQRYLKFVKKTGCEVIVMMPVPQRYLPAELSDLATCITLDKNIRLPALSENKVRNVDEQSPSVLLMENDKAGKLLAKLALAIQIEPALLRAVRNQLTDVDADVAVEAVAWLHQNVETTSIGLFFRKESRETYIEMFKKMSLQEQTQCFDLIVEYHRHYFPTLRYEEIDHFNQYTNVESKKIGDEARLHLVQITKAMIQESTHTGLKRWSNGYLGRQLLKERKDNQLMAAIWATLHQNLGDQSNIEIPQGLSLVDVRPFLKSTSASKRLRLVQSQNQLMWQLDKKSNSDFSDGTSELLTFDTVTNNLSNRIEWQDGSQQIFLHSLQDSHITNNKQSISLDLLDTTRLTLEIGKDVIVIEPFKKPAWAKGMGCDQYGLFVKQRNNQVAEYYYWHPPTLNSDGFWYKHRPQSLPPKPNWADVIGRDQYGLFAELNINDVTQTMRWINPCEFLMGSPEDEIDRSEDEKQHKVILTDGYWLADTGCTQALWRTVMRDNSEYDRQNGELPIDNTNWYKAQEFIQKINHLKPELGLRLPTEAEWENACRAGTKTPFSFGENINTDQVNYNGDYPYRGAEKGLDRKAMTEVKVLPSNPWGLYQMHGNIWEWCHDWYSEYTNETENPIGPNNGESRVLRGGSWIHYARSARSARRYAYDPDYAGIFGLTGFRLARGSGDSQGRDSE